jgi:membrane-associated protein
MFFGGLWYASGMDIIRLAADFLLHLDMHLTALVAQYGTLSYAILFVIVFVETGLIVVPFLPGDSLLFAAGALAAAGALNVWGVFGLLAAAAILGDSVNYGIGRTLGKAIVANPRIAFVNEAHIQRTEEFFEKHGTKTIVLARFVPIVRTFAPFVAGVGNMRYRVFVTYNIIGGLLWVALFTFMGYAFGNLAIVQEEFHYVIFGIIFLSLLPVIFEYVKAKRQRA